MWESGRCSGAVYHGERAHLALLNKAYAAFSLTNPLHPDIWPSSMKFEAETVKWVSPVANELATSVGTRMDGHCLTYS